MKKLLSIILCLTILLGSSYHSQTVYAATAAKSIKLNKTSINIETNKSYTLKATIAPTNITDKKVTWSSSKSSIVKVDTSGKITGNAVGSATITAKTSNGLKATCKVTVKDKNWNNPDYATITIKSGATVKIGMTLKELKKILGEPDRTAQYKWSDVTAYTWKDSNYDYYVLAYITNITNKCYMLVCSGTKMTTSFGVKYGIPEDEANELMMKNIDEASKGTTSIGIMTDFRGSGIVGLVLFDYKLDYQYNKDKRKWLDNEEANTEFSMQAVDALNLYRKFEGCNLAVYKEGARKLAEYRIDLCNKYKKYLVHDTPNGELDNYDWFEQSKYKTLEGGSSGREVATPGGKYDPAEIVTTWEHSKDHWYSIMLDTTGSYEWMGVGLADGDYGEYLCTTFGPSIENDEPQEGDPSN
ncbi:MAG: hypothetical protein K0S47_2416 [Herbinix sp.]|jgi:hypothetical protein|nr:hypothetical protein [Herbinix sp.]